MESLSDDAQDLLVGHQAALLSAMSSELRVLSDWEARSIGDGVGASVTVKAIDEEDVWGMHVGSC